MGLLIFFVLMCILIGAIAKRTGRSVMLWFFISVLISPLFAGIILFIIWLFNGSVEEVESDKMFKTYSEAYDFVTENYELNFKDTCHAAKNLYKNAMCDPGSIQAIMNRYC